MNETESKKPKRRWLRYSLRTLLIVVTVACVALGWKVNQARRQREAAEALREKGIHVIYDYQLSQTAPPGPEWLRDWLGIDYFAHVVSVHNGGEGWYPLSNGDLPHLLGLPYLEEFHLRKSETVTDEGLTTLAGLHRLRRLTLNSTSISDDGLRSLRNLPSLEVLDLRGTDVTDKSLMDLSRFPKLRMLYLARRHVTSDVVKQLEEAMPQLKVVLGN